MTIEILTPIHKLLKGQQLLPDSIRQNAVLLRFDPATPAKTSLLADFYRIQLTPELKQERLSESDFYRAELYQPTRSGARPRPCRTCGQLMTVATIQYQKCGNRKCRQHGRLVHSGPVRGVIDVKFQDDWIVSREPTLFEGIAGECVKVRACLLILDRRYDEVVLAAVYRTAGVVCDQYGWKLL